MQALDPPSQELAHLALTEMEAQITRNPMDARFYVILGAFLTRTGNTELALQKLIEAQKLSPRKQTILFELGSAYSQMKDYPKAFETFKQAYELEPHYDQARILYAAAAIYVKNEKLAQELLAPLSPAQVLQDDNILSAYYNTGQNVKVLQVWKSRADADPTSGEKRLSLAAAYLLNKDKKNAIAEIQKIIAQFPAFKEQGESYIKEIQAGKTL